MKKVSKLLSILLALVIFVSPMGGFFSIKAEAASSWVSSWATSMVDSAITLASLNLQDLIPARSTIRIELPVGERSPLPHRAQAEQGEAFRNFAFCILHFAFCICKAVFRHLAEKLFVVLLNYGSL